MSSLSVEAQQALRTAYLDLFCSQRGCARARFRDTERLIYGPGPMRSCGNSDGRCCGPTSMTRLSKMPSPRSSRC